MGTSGFKLLEERIRIGRRKRNGKRAVIVIVVLAAILVFVRFSLGISMVDGDSMAPSCQKGDLVFYFKPAKNYRPGDLVIFRKWDGFLSLKRITAGPGQTVEIKEDGLFINGSAVSEAYTDTPTEARGEITYPLTLGNNEYFVLGDNRVNSLDSRDYGPVSRERLIGKVFYVYRRNQAAARMILPVSPVLAEMQKEVYIDSFLQENPVYRVRTAPGVEFEDLGLPAYLKAKASPGQLITGEVIYVPVSWSDGGHYNKDKEGKWTVTAVPDGNYIYAGAEPFAVVEVDTSLPADVVVITDPASGEETRIEEASSQGAGGSMDEAAAGINPSAGGQEAASGDAGASAGGQSGAEGSPESAVSAGGEILHQGEGSVVYSYAPRFAVNPVILILIGAALVLIAAGLIILRHSARKKKRQQRYEYFSDL